MNIQLTVDLISIQTKEYREIKSLQLKHRVGSFECIIIIITSQLKKHYEASHLQRWPLHQDESKLCSVDVVQQALMTKQQFHRTFLLFFCHFWYFEAADV